MRRAVLAATTGVALEFYDFITFAFFAIQIGNSFFPSTDRYLSLMGSLATFGAGFISRPVGAFILGGLADRIGRKPIMLASMVMMGAAITTLALTPSYAAIGVAAPVIVILARLVQGFALGGEVGSSTVYMMEAGDAAKRGFNVSLQAVAQLVAASVGSLVGLMLSAVLTEAQLSQFGWRVALLLGVAIVPFAIWARRVLPETLHGHEPAPPAAASASASGPGTARVAICGFLIIGSGTIATYIFNYTATFGQTELQMAARDAMSAQLAGNVIGAVAAVAGGWLCDRFGRRPLLIWPQVAFTLLIAPCYIWLLSARTPFAFITVSLLLGWVATLPTAAIYATIAESLPRRLRSRGFALIYALPVAILGGSTQLFITWLLKATGTPMSLAWYLTGVEAVGLLAMLAMPESAPHKRALAAAAPEPAAA